MSIKRREVEVVKAECARLLERIAEMERSAGWTRYGRTPNASGDYNHATSKPHSDDWFNTGKFTAAVKRASMDLSKALVEIRR